MHSVLSPCFEPPDGWAFELTLQTAAGLQSRRIARRRCPPVKALALDTHQLISRPSKLRPWRSARVAFWCRSTAIQPTRRLSLDVDLPPEAAKGDTVLGRAERVADEFGIELETEILQARDVGTAIVDE